MWKKMRHNVRRRLLSGVLLFVPFGVALLVMRWLFRWLSGFLQPVVKKAISAPEVSALFKSVPETYVTIVVSVLSILILLFLLYLVGAIGQFVLGRRLIAAGERVLMWIPLVGAVYSATKQVTQAFSVPDRAAFESVVLLEFPRPGFMAVGFLTGHIQDRDGRKYCKVFIPTSPNPTTGFLEVVPAEAVRKTSMSIEEAFKMIISGGLVQADIFGSFQEGRPGTKSEPKSGGSQSEKSAPTGT
ncbi:MAG: DUF502 domain-containing protein [Deltaproteobacteria bacterium]|jgi:uncharacterized membrane protein